MATKNIELGTGTLYVRELDDIDADIEALRQEKQKAKAVEEQKKRADETWMIYHSYVEAGFTEEQAWEIVMACIKK